MLMFEWISVLLLAAVILTAAQRGTLHRLRVQGEIGDESFNACRKSLTGRNSTPRRPAVSNP